MGDAGAVGGRDFERRPGELSREEALEKLAATVDFEMFRPILLRALHGLSLAQTS